MAHKENSLETVEIKSILKSEITFRVYVMISNFYNGIELYLINAHAYEIDLLHTTLPIPSVKLLIIGD